MLQSPGTHGWLARQDREARHSVPADEQTLLHRLVQADPTALEVLYQQHVAALLGYLLTLTRDHSIAEEVLQDTLLAAWRAARGFRARSSVRTWLFAIARRRARDRSFRLRLPRAEDDERLTAVDPAPGPELATLQKADMHDLVRESNELSVLHREVLALVFVHERSYEEAARVLDVPLGTVKSRLNAARQTLQQRRQRDNEARS